MNDRTSPTTARLDALSLELLDRLSTEVGRPKESASTELVGGFVKAGSKLEGLLREVIIVTAEIERCAVDDLLASVGRPGGSKPSLRKSMAGPLAHGLRIYFSQRPPASSPAVVRPLIEDLLSSDSRILSFIRVRNEIAKEGGDPAGGRTATRNLKVLVADFRRNAGWI